jgi:pimeloyl-ACP methyl ester carboxylesterase
MRIISTQLVELLLTRRQVRYDMRGHGRSVKPDAPAGHTAALYAADFAAVSAAYGLVKPLFVGWSFGG